MIKRELNPNCGIRLKKCLQEQKISQKELSIKSGYTQQYISNIIVGKKMLSLEAARVFSKLLKVREEYLLCEEDIKTDQEIAEEWHKNFREKDNIAVKLLNLAGYEPVCDFIRNWKELGLDEINSTPHRDDPHPVIPFELEKKIRYSTEIISPNGKTFYCDMEDIHLLGYELIEYIHLRMKQLESKYAWEFDDAKISRKCEGSELNYYERPNNEIFVDILKDSGMWLNHNSDVFPDIDYTAEDD